LQIPGQPHRRLGDHWRSCSPSARVTRWDIPDMA
jgi:hypothetical protein